MSDLHTEHAERELLLEQLARLGVHAPIVPYPAHTTVAEGKRLRGELPGTFTKNLLLKDRKSGRFFVAAGKARSERGVCP